MPAITPGTIHAGPANVWYGVTLPGDGNTVDLTAGAPGSGTYLGATEGPTTFAYERTETDIVSAQHTAAHDAVLDLEMMNLTVTAQQSTIENFMQAMAQGTQVNNEGTPQGDAIFLGGNTAIAFGMIVATAALRDGSGKYLHIGIYRTRPESPFSWAAERGKPSPYQIKFKGYSVVTYTAGKQLGYYKFDD